MYYMDYIANKNLKNDKNVNTLWLRKAYIKLKICEKKYWFFDFPFLSYIFKNLYVYEYGVPELPPCFSYEQNYWLKKKDAT